MGDGVWTLGVPDGVIAPVEPSLVRGIQERQEVERHRGSALCRPCPGQHRVAHPPWPGHRVTEVRDTMTSEETED